MAEPAPIYADAAEALRVARVLADPRTREAFMAALRAGRAAPEPLAAPAHSLTETCLPAPPAAAEPAPNPPAGTLENPRP